jgi:hypothetical protein
MATTTIKRPNTTKTNTTKTNTTKTNTTKPKTSTTKSARTTGTRVEASVLGTTRLPQPVQDQLLRADPAPLHEVPQDIGAEAVLARVEGLLGKGHFGAALQEAGALKLSVPALGSRYEFLRQEKLSRAHIGIADRYVLRGDSKNARRFYERALAPDSADPAVKEITQLATKAFDDLLGRRSALIKQLKTAVAKNDFTQWCGAKNTLTGLSLVDVDAVRARIYPDFRLESAFGERPPIDPHPGYLDPLPVETAVVEFPSSVPSTIFRAHTDAAVDVDAPPAGLARAASNQIHASLAFPLMANVLRAKAGLFAVAQGLNVSGQADGVLPLFRYEHLRDRTKELVAYIQGIESRMFPVQFELDDFAEAISAIKRPLDAQQAELVAVNQRITELTQTLTQLAQAEQALDGVVIALDQAQADCDCDWFCWLVAFICDAFITALIVAVAVAVATTTAGIGAVIVAEALLVIGIGAGMGTAYLVAATWSCENVGVIERSMKASRDGVRASIADDEAELQHALATRDVLIASINALTQELDAAYQSNAARVLDAKTLDAIQAQYNRLRQSLLTRAQAVAKLAQSAFNFERDADVALIRDAYYDQDLKGYTGAETLLHDLSGLDHIDLTGRTQKAIQLNQMVSLSKHNPLSFIALSATRTARFTTSLADFDRWYPGTYLQRIKEVRVEVMIGDTAVPARGYLSNDGVSLVRFADSKGARPVDNVRVFAEPDADIARLCYKRLQRRRHIDTMAFPEFESRLYDRRMGRLQDRERNFFENVGLESTWSIELLPDQPFDLSLITDIRIWFQYEALFDENLRRVAEAKRYTDCREMVALPITKSIRDAGGTGDLSAPLIFKTTRAIFDAPVVDKKILDAGLAVKLKASKPLGGAATLQVALAGAPAAVVTTNDAGVVASASDHPTGSGVAQLAAMVQGKSVDGEWTVRLQSLPAGLAPDDIDEIFLLLHCEYSP